MTDLDERPRPSGTAPGPSDVRGARIRVAVFASLLLVVLAVAWSIGRVVTTGATPAVPPAAGHGMAGMPGMDMPGTGMPGMDRAAADLPQGLVVSRDGYTVDVAQTVLPVAQPTRLTFRILGPDGRAVTDFTPHQEQLLHLIVVRRDVTGFQHLHPTLAPDGTWTQPITFAAAGSYRAYLQFVTATRELTLGVDLDVAGDYRPRPLPAPVPTSDVDGFRVTITPPGTDGTVGFRVTRDGAPVADLQPYLGALGHLTALRVGDMAFLHIHPRTTTGSGPDVSFAAGAPPPGTYRLFFQFRVAGAVHTAEFGLDLR